MYHTSPRTSSVVSNFEANQNYRDVQDPSVIVKFRLTSEDGFLLAWTTTPWTLPTNLALGVGKDITYVRVRDRASGEHWILAKDRLDFAFFGTGKKKKKGSSSREAPWDFVEEIKGSKLEGLEYEPLFPWFKEHPNSFRVLNAEFVSTDNGTGIVHLAPCFGEDDFHICRQHGIDIADSLDESGYFLPLISDYEGLPFKEADRQICRDLKEKGMLIRQETIVHSYPFDERTDTPLIYRAVPSWYVAVEKLVDKLVRNNQTINWVPQHLKDGRMGNWLANARDWAISRNRFWGTPLPVWICDQNPEHLDVMASVSELEQKTGREIRDIHMHRIQDLQFACSHCSGTMKAVGLVFDCWFESGSMPYAQHHFPFEKSEEFKGIFPADFVAEGLDQTRGWFYTLNVLSTALFDQPAFKNVVVNGTILDERGKKMSKRHKNYTPPGKLMDTFGADSVRLYMLDSPLLRGDNLMFSDKGVRDVTRSILLPLWNAYSFLATYASTDGWSPDASLLEGTAPMPEKDPDRWIISVLQSLIGTVHQRMEEYKLYQVIPRVIAFVDDLTNWYIRLNRRRFWGQGQEMGRISKDQQDAYSCLSYVLLEFSKVLAPFAPFISDRIYKNIIDGHPKAPESVHLCNYPEKQEGLCDKALEEQTALVRKVTILGRSLRQQHKIRVRQGLSSMTVITRRESDRRAIARSTELLKDELNVRSVQFSTDEASHVKLSVKPNLRTLGRRLGQDLAPFKKDLEEYSRSHNKVASLLKELEEKNEIELFNVRISQDDLLILRGPLDERKIATDSGVTVLLDTRLTPELISESYARELVNRIQNLRKESRLNVSDRIRLRMLSSGELAKAATLCQEYIMKETLCAEFSILTGAASVEYRFSQDYDIEGMPCHLSLEPVG